MRVGIINVNKLVRIRRSFRLGWRAVVTPLFLLYAYSWWMGFVSSYTTGDDLLLPGEGVRVQTLVFFTALFALATVALFRKDDFARLFFAVASAFCALNTLLFAAWPGKYWIPRMAVAGGVAPLPALGIGLLVLWLNWKYLILYSYVLWLSLIPYGQGRAFRPQVIHTLRVMPARKQNLKEHRRIQSGHEAPSRKALIRFLTVGSAAVLAGLASWTLASMVSVNDDLAKSIHRLELFRAAHVVRNFSLASFDRGEVSVEKVLWTNVLAFFGLFNFIAFGFLWHRWRRSRIPIDRVSAPQHIPPSSVLLLRHSKDDVMRMPRRRFSLARLPFLLFEWNYTFEELMAERLAFIGPLYSLGSKRDESPIFGEALGRLKAKLDKAPWAPLRRLGAGVERLRRSLPEGLPPPGAPRLYPKDWRAFVKESMPQARAIVVVIGSAKDDKLESTYLQEELDWIKGGGYLDKTIFLMPPALLSWKLRTRWRTFAEYAAGALDAERALPKAKRVLGVCFRMQEPVVITGSERSEFFYESALDIAGAFAGSAPGQGGAMIMKWRTVAPPPNGASLTVNSNL